MFFFFFCLLHFLSLQLHFLLNRIDETTSTTHSGKNKKRKKTLGGSGWAGWAQRYNTHKQKKSPERTCKKNGLCINHQFMHLLYWLLHSSPSSTCNKRRLTRTPCRQFKQVIGYVCMDFLEECEMPFLLAAPLQRQGTTQRNEGRAVTGNFYSLVRAIFVRFDTKESQKTTKKRDGKHTCTSNRHKGRGRRICMNMFLYHTLLS